MTKEYFQAKKSKHIPQGIFHWDTDFVMFSKEKRGPRVMEDVLEMEDWAIKESSMDLRNLEAKVGMKTPRCLLQWMHADVQDYDMLQPEHLPRDLIMKIKTLKLEMRNLRSADVKILQQLEALNDGMECLRWLWEERSPSINLTTSQSSQNTTLNPNYQSILDLEQEKQNLTSANDENETGEDSVSSTIKPELHHVQAFDKIIAKESQSKILDLNVNGGETFQNRQSDPELSGGHLLGYDICWHWVENEDDVIFL
ncbi:leucine rich adaptor protein 1-like [Hoplias malabaricus]|uniref:leucine rich adaptor protein 1-like n=1 Tax=Hoplias malabaricus TaxID=27720 RepID=UPI003462B607